MRNTVISYNFYFVTFYIFLLFFSPKIGFFDFRLFLLPIGYFVTNKNLIIPKLTFKLLISVSFLILYYLIISTINRSDYIEVLRYIRVLNSILLISFLFTSNRFSQDFILKGIIISLMLNVIIMYANLIFPTFHTLIQSIYFDKGKILEKTNRVVGLAAGFDSSGIILLITILFFIYIYLNKKNIYTLFFLLISIGISFFVSRGTIIYLFLICIYFLFKFISKINLKNLIYFSLFILIFSSLILPYVSNIFLSSVNLDFIGVEADVDTSVIEDQYAKTDIFVLLESFLVVPETTFQFYFGATSSVDVDSGYIKEINQIGVVGVILYLLIHWYIFFSLKKSKKISFFSYKNLLFLIVTLITIANIKNQILFTRGIFEIYLTLSFFYLKYGE